MDYPEAAHYRGLRAFKGNNDGDRFWIEGQADILSGGVYGAGGMGMVEGEHLQPLQPEGLHCCDLLTRIHKEVAAAFLEISGRMNT